MYLLSNSRNPIENERNALGGLHTEGLKNASKFYYFWEGRRGWTIISGTGELHFLLPFWHCFQVCSVLDSLEREYKREDDMLQKHLSSGNDVDKVTLITQLITKHQEQKEAFLKACTLARRTAETFLKYSNRSLQFFTQPTSPQSTFKGPEAKVKG